MTTTVETLPITDTRTPADGDQLIDEVKRAYERDTAIYPVGGGTHLGLGMPARREGIKLSLESLHQIIDYPARDMTITVQPGITMRQLSETLAAEGQRLPVDVPSADRATLGGAVATNTSGPRRYGSGTLRDYVIGISAVDGCGRPFRGGGRVVKNVAGYDFCKLLTGSLGTLGVISQLTLKLKPLPERSLLMACDVDNLDQAEQLLARLVHSQTSPAAVELLAGPAWEEDAPPANVGDAAKLVVGLEGTDLEVTWMESQLRAEWHDAGVSDKQIHVSKEDDAVVLWQRLVDFPATGDSPLVLKASVVPGGTTAIVATAREVDPGCSIQAHAGNGVVIIRCSKFPEAGLSRALAGSLLPAATRQHGNIVVLSNPSGAEMTRQIVWGGIDVPYWLMTRIKKEFDPKNLLNPDRFVYDRTD